ncbi:hypothetical protein O181_053238 [Austropuccinia psidii MF-1]|uniref:Uncharacterized protein n=1 Tax=Austropuccinia psidii MF-1 TaxID=1389203 RepID=A0A9Q3E710_9BASI|nr:hypothetical protein [Austropuccinia psidii MF-1]
MEEISTRTRIVKNWNRNPQKSGHTVKPAPRKPIEKIKRPPLKCNKCGIISNLANYFTKKRINEVHINETEENLAEEEKSIEDYLPSEEEEM